jgi:hypothetical protein
MCVESNFSALLWFVCSGLLRYAMNHRVCIALLQRVQGYWKILSTAKYKICGVQWSFIHLHFHKLAIWLIWCEFTGDMISRIAYRLLLVASVWLLPKVSRKVENNATASSFWQRKCVRVNFNDIRRGTKTELQITTASGGLSPSGGCLGAGENAFRLKF